MIPPYCFWFKETVEGTDLLYPQWQDIHNPEWVIGLFETDEGSALEGSSIAIESSIVLGTEGRCIDEASSILLGNVFYNRAGQAKTLPSGGKALMFYTEGSLNGYLHRFIGGNGVTYGAHVNGEGNFVGYAPVGEEYTWDNFLNEKITLLPGDVSLARKVFIDGNCNLTLDVGESPFADPIDCVCQTLEGSDNSNTGFALVGVVAGEYGGKDGSGKTKKPNVDDAAGYFDASDIEAIQNNLKFIEDNLGTEVNIYISSIKTSEEDLERLSTQYDVETKAGKPVIWYKIGSELKLEQKNNGLIEAPLLSMLIQMGLRDIKSYTDLIKDIVENNLKIPEKYWNAALSNYDDRYADIYRVFTINNFTYRESFPVIAGIYNGLLNELSGVFEIAGLIAGYATDSKIREQVNTAISNFSFTKIFDAFKEAHTGNVYQIGHQVGLDIVAVATIVIPLTKGNAINKGLNALRKAANITRNLSKSALIFIQRVEDQLIAGLLAIERELNDQINLVIRALRNGQPYDVMVFGDGTGVFVSKWMDDAGGSVLYHMDDVNVDGVGNTSLDIVKNGDEIGVRRSGGVLDWLDDITDVDLKKAITDAGKDSDLWKLFANATDAVERAGLTEAWGIIKNRTTLRANPRYLKVIYNAKSKFRNAGQSGVSTFTEFIDGHQSLGKFLDNLDVAQNQFGSIQKATFQGVKSSQEVRVFIDDVYVGKLVDGNIIPPNLPNARSLIANSTDFAHLADDPFELNKVLNNYDEVKRLGYDDWKKSLPPVRSLDEIAPNGIIPPNSEVNNQFQRWFDGLKFDELILVLNKKGLKDILERRVRWPKNYHEWCMVCEILQFKKWDVSMSEIHRFRTKTEDLIWKVPDDVPDVGIRGLPGKHGETGSGTFHVELRKIIQDSNTLSDFNNKLDGLIERWKIPPSLLPDLIK